MEQVIQHGLSQVSKDHATNCPGLTLPVTLPNPTERISDLATSETAMSTSLRSDSHSAVQLLKSAKTRLKKSLASFAGGQGYHGQFQWARIVMNRETLALIQRYHPESLSVLEIAGSFWQDRCRFRGYKAVFHPEYDVCNGPLPEKFDLIIAEQVFEHLLWPYRAGRNIYEMLNPGGLFLVTTPFLLKIHDDPQDCSRWTATGMASFSCGMRIPARRRRGILLGQPQLHQRQFPPLAMLPALASLLGE